MRESDQPSHQQHLQKMDKIQKKKQTQKNPRYFRILESTESWVTQAKRLKSHVKSGSYTVTSEMSWFQENKN